VSRDELIKLLTDLAADNDGDCENNHGRADDALLEYINDKAITQAFEMIEKWYA